MATTGDSSPKGSYTDNKTRGYNSKAKTLIYGGEERPETPVHVGKRSVAHKGVNSPAPFATSAPEPAPEVNPSAQRTYVTKAKTKEGAGKPTGATFDADVYRQQLALNAQNMQASKARNYAGNGVFN